MDPSVAELLAMTTVDNVFEWLESTKELQDAMTAAMGAPPSLRSWAHIPDSRFAAEVRGFKVGDRSLTPAEEGQVGQVSRIARLALLARTSSAVGGANLPLAMSGSLAAPGGGGDSSSAAGAPTPVAETASLGSIKIRLSTVLDQADDTEIKPLTTEELRRLLAEWITHINDGEDPSEDQEATGEQLAALNFRLRMGGTPFVDFGVWRPHGADLGRALRFAAFFLSPAGEFQRKELAGPASFAEWDRSWRVFGFAMEVLGAASRTRLCRYRDQVAQLARDYPAFWWVVACADLTMRRTHLERIRRRLDSEHAQLGAAGLSSTFDPKRPWDAAFREAACDSVFWTKEVDKKVIQFSTSQKSKGQLTDPGFGDLRLEPSSDPGSQGRGRGRSGGDAADGVEMPEKKKARKPRESAREKAWTRDPGSGGAAGKGKGKGKHLDAKTHDGKYYRDSTGASICWNWNRVQGGCTDPCPMKRAHVCEFCRGAHRGCAHKE